MKASLSLRAQCLLLDPTKLAASLFHVPFLPSALVILTYSAVSVQSYPPVPWSAQSPGRPGSGPRPRSCTRLNADFPRQYHQPCFASGSGRGADRPDVKSTTHQGIQHMKVLGVNILLQCILSSLRFAPKGLLRFSELLLSKSFSKTEHIPKNTSQTVDRHFDHCGRLDAVRAAPEPRRLYSVTLGEHPGKHSTPPLLWDQHLLPWHRHAYRPRCWLHPSRLGSACI